MPKTINLSKNNARCLILQSQGINFEFPNALAALGRLSYIQIDTISVIQRAHHHVFFSRFENYKPEDLDRMMNNKDVFEYWSHAAAYLPMSDYRYSLMEKAEYASGKRHWFEKDKKMMGHVLKRIEEEGSLQSKDFEHPRSGKNPWYEWKPAKMALTQLFMEGKLMVARRQGFQKVFDLTERVLPETADITKPTKTEYCRYLVSKSVKAQGVISEKEISYLRRGLKPTLGKVLKSMIGNGELVQVQIAGEDQVYYSLPSCLEIINSDSKQNEVHILSPFDNLVIQRDRLKCFFNFDYQIECYVPEKKRKYGYFCLPILFGEQFVGRLDPKADRKTGTFHVKQLWIEPQFEPSDQFYFKFSQKLKSLAKFCNCIDIKLERQVPKKLKTELIRFLK